MGQISDMSTDALDKLSDMQIRCLRLVADLKKTEQIAAELGISPSTVNTHIERAITRLSVPNRREAARLVVARDRANAVVAGATGARPSAPSINPLDAPQTSLPLVVDRPEKLPTEESPLSARDKSEAPPASTQAGGRRRNDLTIPQRLLLAVFSLVLICVGLGGLGAAIGKLSDWRAAHGAHQ